jgi:hypothetical protein
MMTTMNNNKEDDEEVAYLDVRLYKDGECIIELLDNGKLSNLLAEGIINDDKLFNFFANVLMNYQLKLSKNK